MTTEEKKVVIKLVMDMYKKSDDLTDREKLLVGYINYLEGMIEIKESEIRFQSAMKEVYKKGGERK